MLHAYTGQLLVELSADRDAYLSLRRETVSFTLGLETFHDGQGITIVFGGHQGEYLEVFYGDYHDIKKSADYGGKKILDSDKKNFFKISWNKYNGEFKVEKLEDNIWNEK